MRYVLLAVVALLLLPLRPAQAASASPTVTELVSSANPADPGEPVTLTASVSGGVAGTPRGSVTFAELGQSPFGSAELAGGQASLAVTLPAGVHLIATSYGGNASFFASSDTLTQRWGPPVASRVRLSAGPNPAPTGFPVTLTAIVNPAAGVALATGHVTFMDGSTALGVAPLGSPQLAVEGPDPAAALTVVNLSPGVHTITAAYAGDGNLAPGTASLSEVIGPPVATSTSVAAGPNPSARGQVVGVTVSVSAQGVSTFPTGTVALAEGSAVLATAQVGAGGVTLFTLTDLAPGTHQITASYGGGADFAPSTSSPAAQTVLGGGSASTSISLSAAGQPAFGQPVTVRATVWAGPQTAPTGSVTFTNFGRPLGTAPLSADGTASLTFTPAAGLLSLDAAYSGDETFAASTTTQPFGLLVLPMSTTVSLTGSPNPATVTETVTLVARVVPAGAAAPGPTGHVSFMDGTVPLGTADLDASGTATLVVESLAPGSHLVTAQYLGDGTFAASESAGLSEAVEETSITG